MRPSFPVGFGTSLTPEAAKRYSYKDMLPAIDAAWRAGVTLFDTAPVYGMGEAERILGSHPDRSRMQIATKLGPENSTPAGVVRSVEASLARLRRDHIDLLQLHWQNPEVPLAETMGAMEILVERGLVRALGACNLSLRGLREAEAGLRKVKLATLQLEYNLFDRTAESDLLPYCRERGILALAYSPLHRGRIANGSAQLARLDSIARARGATAAQIALAWLARDGNVVPLPNSMHPARAAENAASGALTLSSEEIDSIERATRPETATIAPSAILAARPGETGAFHSRAEAEANRLGHTPSPRELAAQIRAGEFLKPVRVRRTETGAYSSDAGEKEFELLEGRLRYWAWVLAHGENHPIPVLIDL